MEPNFEHNKIHFNQELCLQDEEEKREQNEKFFSNHGLYVDDKNCHPSEKLLEYMKHFMETEKNFIFNFGDDIEFRVNGYKVKLCRACVRYNEVKTVIREHTKYCRNCRFQNSLLTQPYECLRSMVRPNMLKSHDGYVMDYTDINYDYLKHCHDSMLPTYNDFCID